MGESAARPPRLATDPGIEAILGDALPAMTTIVEHRRRNPNPPGQPQASERTLRACVQVQVWIESDGTESMTVVGNEDATPLQVKGLLHDAVYAVAHVNEPGFTS